MRRFTYSALISALMLIAMPVASQAADVLTPGFLKLSLYTNIVGNTVADLTADPTCPNSPTEVRYLRSFNTREALPTDV